jgi:hypothetical protein
MQVHFSQLAYTIIAKCAIAGTRVCDEKRNHLENIFFSVVCSKIALYANATS